MEIEVSASNNKSYKERADEVLLPRANSGVAVSFSGLQSDDEIFDILLSYSTKKVFNDGKLQ